MNGIKEKLMSTNTVNEKDIVISFMNAVVNDDNIMPDGSINWNFVDADIHMDASEADMILPENYHSIFDSLVNKFLGA